MAERAIATRCDHDVSEIALRANEINKRCASERCGQGVFLLPRKRENMYGTSKLDEAFATLWWKFLIHIGCFEIYRVKIFIKLRRRTCRCAASGSLKLPYSVSVIFSHLARAKTLPASDRRYEELKMKNGEKFNKKKKVRNLYAPHTTVKRSDA